MSKGQGWGWDVVWTGCCVGSGSRERAKRRQTAVYVSHGQVPFREPPALSDSLQLQDLPHHSNQGRIASWETPSQWQTMAGLLGPFLPKVGVLSWAIFVLVRLVEMVLKLHHSRGSSYLILLPSPSLFLGG